MVRDWAAFDPDIFINGEPQFMDANLQISSIDICLSPSTSWAESSFRVWGRCSPGMTSGGDEMGAGISVGASRVDVSKLESSKSTDEFILEGWKPIVYDS